MAQPELSQADEDFLKNWYVVLKNKRLEELDETSMRKLDDDFHDFMGDNAKPPEKPHNRRMLAFLAGLSGENETVNPMGATNDRERQLVIHAWQLHDHMCNTARANSSEQLARYGATLAILAIAYNAITSHRTIEALEFSLMALILVSIYWWAPKADRLYKWIARKVGLE